MENSGSGRMLSNRQTDALYEADELLSFIAGAITPRLEVVEEDSSPFHDGLYRNILEVKKRIDLTVIDDEEAPEQHTPAASAPQKETKAMQQATMKLCSQINLIDQLSEDLQTKADHAATDLTRSREYHALAAMLANHRAALLEISAIVEGQRVA